MSVEEYKALISDALPPGADQEEIISFLDERGWPYAWDPSRNAYMTRDPNDTSKWKGYQIFLYVNDEGEFQRVEVITLRSGI